MKIIITESQLKILLKEGISDDQEFRNTIKKFESEVIGDDNKHYTFDDKDSGKEKTWVRTNTPPFGGTLTIGWGHTGPEAKPNNRITNAEAERLLTDDIEKEERKTKDLFSKYDKYPTYVKRALVNAVYRGEAKSSYEWVKDINAGKWFSAAKKYLEGWDIDFSKAKDPKYEGGLADRMVTNQTAFLKYAKELKNKKISSNKETEEQRCKKMQPKELVYHPECDKYFKSNYNMNYGIDLKNQYVVKQGDTLSSIAAKYPDKTITAASIKKLNNLKSDNIEPGQTLKIK